LYAFLSRYAGNEILVRLGSSKKLLIYELETFLLLQIPNIRQQFSSLAVNSLFFNHFISLFFIFIAKVFDLQTRNFLQDQGN